MPATIITKPRIAKATDRATGAWTSSPSRVRPVAWTRELPFTLTLRAPSAGAPDLGVRGAPGERDQVRHEQRRPDRRDQLPHHLVVEAHAVSSVPTGPALTRQRGRPGGAAVAGGATTCATTNSPSAGRAPAIGSSAPSTISDAAGHRDRGVDRVVPGGAEGGRRLRSLGRRVRPSA